MVSTRELRPGEDPPNAGPWIMVVVSDEHDHVETKQHSLGATVMTSPEQAEGSVSEAQAAAERDGVPTVYVRRMTENQNG